jgi:hypothetical protein
MDDIIDLAPNAEAKVRPNLKVPFLLDADGRQLYESKRMRPVSDRSQKEFLGEWCEAPLARAGKEVIGFHTSTCAAERNRSAWGRTFSALRNRLDPGKANSSDQEAEDKEVALTY